MVVTEEKKVFNYSLKLTSDKTGEDIALKICPNEDLLKLIKSVVVSGEIDYSLNDGEDFNLRQRARIKTYVNNVLRNAGYLLFDLDLLNNDYVIFNIKTTEKLETVISELKYSIKNLIEVVKNSDIDLTITFKSN